MRACGARCVAARRAPGAGGGARRTAKCEEIEKGGGEEDAGKKGQPLEKEEKAVERSSGRAGCGVEGKTGKRVGGGRESEARTQLRAV